MKYRGKRTGKVYTVVFSDEHGVLTEGLTGNRTWWTKGDVKRLLEEYREPRTLKGYANIWETPEGVKIGCLYETRSGAEHALKLDSYKSLDIIEVSWTEEV